MHCPTGDPVGHRRVSGGQAGSGTRRGAADEVLVWARTLGDVASVRVEFTVEPFHDGHPGDHVLAAWRAVEADGCQLEPGPFSSEAEVPDAIVAKVVADLLRAALDGGATRVTVQVEPIIAEPGAS